jgi:hypothetical protein
MLTAMFAKTEKLQQTNQFQPQSQSHTVTLQEM